VDITSPRFTQRSTPCPKNCLCNLLGLQTHALYTLPKIQSQTMNSHLLGKVSIQGITIKSGKRKWRGNDISKLTKARLMGSCQKCKPPFPITFVLSYHPHAWDELHYVYFLFIGCHIKIIQDTLISLCKRLTYTSECRCSSDAPPFFLHYCLKSILF
jgi:hypothetical protein